MDFVLQKWGVCVTSPISPPQIDTKITNTRRTAPTWKLTLGTINWKEILPGVTAVEAIHLIKPDWIKLSPVERLPVTVQNAATIEGAIFGEDDQLPQA